MAIDYAKTRCPDCGKQDKLEITETVGEKCYRYQCNGCAKIKGRKIPLIVDWVDEKTRCPEYLIPKE